MKPNFTSVSIKAITTDAWRAEIRYPHCTFSQYCKSWHAAFNLVEQWIEEERQEQKGEVVV